jgi:hypothetical protein
MLRLWHSGIFSDGSMFYSTDSLADSSGRRLSGAGMGEYARAKRLRLLANWKSHAGTFAGVGFLLSDQTAGGTSCKCKSLRRPGYGHLFRDYASWSPTDPLKSKRAPNAVLQARKAQ